MVRKLALSLAVAAALGVTQANALGLGEIRVKSALNEPLEAEIQLVQVRDLSPLQIRPRMADVDEFSLAGLSKSRFLNDVKFQVNVDPNGQGTISVSSSVPVQEPFLSFLMEVNWPNGRLVREYTLLLDPPVFDPAPTVTTVTAPSATAPSVPSSTSQAPSTPRSSTGTLRTDVNRSSEVYVDNNDTLFEIARDNRPSAQISVEQMMIALLRKNPNAFPTNNINVMKAGVVMQVPTAEEARALTRRQAIAEAARQTAEWRASRRSAAPATAEVPAAESDTAGKPEEGAGEAAAAPEEGDSQLTIVAADPADAAPTEEASTEGEPEAETAEVAEPVVVEDTGPSERELELARQNEELENRLLVTQETVTKVERENQELGETLDSIQEQLGALQRLIELKDQQMAALQAEMLRQAQEANKPQPSALDKLISTLTENPLYLGGAGGLLVLILALLALRKRGKKQDDEDDIEPPKRRSRRAEKKAEEEADEIPEFDEPDANAAAAALAGAGAGAAAAAALADEPSESDDTLEANQAEIDDLDDDLSDLDLDMDLDLDEEPTKPSVDDSPLDGPEVLDESEALAEDPMDAEAEIDSMLDDILDDPEPDTSDATDDDLDALLADDLDADLDADMDELSVTQDELDAELVSEETESADDALDSIDDDLDDELAFEIEEAPVDDEPAEAETSGEADDDDLEGLEFAIDEGEEVAEGEATDDSGDLIDETFFAPEPEKESDEVAPSEDVSPDELIDEAIEADENRTTEQMLQATDEDLDDLVDDDLEQMLADSAQELEEEGHARVSATVEETSTEALLEDDPMDIEIKDTVDFTPDEDPEPLIADGLDAFDGLSLDDAESATPADETTNTTTDEPVADEASADKLDAADDLDIDLDALADEADLDALMDDLPEEAVEEAVQSESVVEEELDLDALLDEPMDSEPSTDSELDSELDSVLEAQSEADDSDDLDDLIMELESEEDEAPARQKTAGEKVEDELTANIAHDLDLNIEDELDDILESTDETVELVEEGDNALGSLEEDDGFDLLDGADETETKLDLARAYIEMDDHEGARDILNEVVNDGSEEQQSEAQKLLDKLK